MLSRAPLLRILMPLILGILVGEAVTPSAVVIILSVTTAVVAYAATEYVARKSPRNAVKYASAPTLLISVTCATLGCALEAAHRTPDINAGECRGHCIYGEITSIRDRDNSTDMRVTILGDCDKAAASITGHKVQVLLDHKELQVTEGDIIAFMSTLSPISNYGNPEEFDYSKYMRRQGITHRQVLGKGQYRIVGHRGSLATASKHTQRHLANTVLHSHLNPATKYFLNAALLGDVSFIDPDVRLQFSKAGLAHMLAISGLHIGIILMLISFVLQPLIYVNGHKLRTLLSMAAIGGYLFITGAPTSAVRATVMIGFVMAAYLAYRQNSSLNALCGAAIAILLFSPYSIHSVGFQLSFSAVLALTLLYPKIAIVSPKRRIAHFAVSSLLTIVIANIGCSVISAHYFHTLPLLSILSNLIIIPLLPFYIGLGALYVIFLLLGIDIGAIGWLLDAGYGCATSMAGLMTRLPLAHIDNIHISAPIMILYILLLIAITLLAHKRSFPRIIATLILMISIAATAIMERATTPSSGFVILNDPSSTPLLYFHGGTGEVWCNDRALDLDEFEQRYRNMLSKYRIKELRMIGDSNTPRTIGPFGVVGGQRIAMVSATRWKYFTAKSPVNVDYMVITRSYYGTIGQLLSIFNPRTVVIAGDVSPESLSKYTSELDSLDVQFHSISLHGAILVTL